MKKFVQRVRLIIPRSGHSIITSGRTEVIYSVNSDLREGTVVVKPAPSLTLKGYCATNGYSGLYLVISTGVCVAAVEDNVEPKRGYANGEPNAVLRKFVASGLLVRVMAAEP